MRLHSIPPSLLHLITAILLAAPHPTSAKPHLPASAYAGFGWNELFARYDCSGQLCGFSDQLCCTAGSACYTDSNDEAQCGPTSAAASYVPAATSNAAGGYWQYYTSIFTETDTVLTTQIYSTYVVPSVTYAPAASASARCNYALNETPCGDICCASDQYCASSGQCAAAYAGQTTTTTAVASGTNVAIPPVRGTSASNVVVTTTKTPTTTIPFETPVQTGANVTLTESHVSSGGLSGGAIAGIVIGVLLGIALLALLCFYCCIKGLLDGCLALFGFGKKRRVTEVDEYERRTHHSSGGGRRTWYGASRPNRPARRKESSHVGREAAGIFAGLAGLWAILGLKRRHERRKEEDNKTEYSYSSEYYTSASSASSDDRRTNRQQSVRYDNRRSQSRR